MTVEQMRSYISDVYPSREWREKVNAMYEDQVIAVYYSMLNRGVFNKPKVPPKSLPKIKQISIFDIMKGEKNA